MATMAKLAKSPWLLHYDGSSCNGCDIEVLACTTPKYDIERFGIINTGDPFQADILLITGGVNHQSESVIRRGGCWHLRLHRRGIQGLLQHQGRRGYRNSCRCVCTGVRGAATGHY